MKKYEQLMARQAQQAKQIIILKNEKVSNLRSILQSKNNDINEFNIAFTNEMNLLDQSKQQSKKRTLANKEEIQQIRKWVDLKVRCMNHLTSVNQSSEKMIAEMNLTMKKIADQELKIKSEVNKINSNFNSFEETQDEISQTHIENHHFQAHNIPVVNAAENKMTIRVERGTQSIECPSIEEFELIYIKKDDRFVCSKPYSDKVTKAVIQFNFHRNMVVLKRDLEAIVNKISQNK